ncbi:FAD-dependent monooxygenase [Rhizomonospora bruguierae]|uniref:FAD-dependent monooxygenase n=1 Tax=Rhizomonospora bruguierae TaxID=1581705 RepID=UPI001BD0BD84|nr:FAD-dependent monooxygenase [Micromonospora sp. NBRC 107566]
MIPTGADVVIVGAGPTGLMLAGDLAAAGVRTAVLERRSRESNLTRAFGVHARTLEVLDARGLADELTATGEPVRELRLFDRVHVDLTRLPSRFPYLLITPQYQVERVLRRRAESLGATLVGGVQVVDLRQDAGEVRVDIAGGQSIRASYVVGTDGVHSRVRQALGLPFPGRAVLQSIMLADVRMTAAPTGVLAVNAVGDCFAFVAPFGDGWFRVFAWDRLDQQPDSAPLDFEEIRAVTRRALGTDFGMHDPRWMARFHSDERQVPTYRVGRVFLAGDAAHIHSPAGGQGMNTGIQDAANLGWKLTAAVHGWAPEDLLDSYHAERHPVGRLVLRSSGAIIRLAMIQSQIPRAARNVIGGTALRIGPIARKVAGTISGIGIAYAPPRGGHPLAGQRAADVPLTGDAQPAARLYEALRDGVFVLVAPPELATIAAPWADRVRQATPADTHTPTMLVRPDGYVAWATGDTLPERRDTAIRDALSTFCGSPTKLGR